MTKSKGSGEGAKTPRAFKWLAAVIPLMAAAVPIIGIFEHWFEPGPNPIPPAPASLAEYVEVCGLANETQSRLEGDYVRYRVSFEHAGDLTSARDALLLVTKQDITATSDLMNQIDALTPPQDMAGVQHALDSDWSRNLAVLGEFREHLSEGVASLPQLVDLVRRQHRVEIAKRSADARERLLRLGRPECRLNSEQVAPNVDWSPALRQKWVVVGLQHGSSGASTETASVTSQKGKVPGALEALPEAAVALPDAEPLKAASKGPNLPTHVSNPDAVHVSTAQAAGNPSAEQPSTTTAP